MQQLRTFFGLSPLLAALGLAGCGGERPQEDPPPEDEALQAGVTITDTEITFVTEPFEIPEGESFRCFWTDFVTDKPLAVAGAHGTQADGGHHVTTYYTGALKDSMDKPCNDIDMLEWRLIAGSGVDGTPVLQLPEGVAVEIPEGQQLVVQAHYINISGAPITVQDTTVLELVAPEEVDEFAAVFTAVDLDFEIPAGTTKYGHESYCRVPRDINVLLMLGHMHELGLDYTLEVVDEDGAVIEELWRVDEWFDYYVSHPPVANFDLGQPLTLSAGTRLRQTCHWEGDPATATGHPTEMCVTFGYYYPDQGELICEPEIEGPVETPENSCAQPGDLGNELGVGLYCSPGGGECATTEGAPICLAAVVPENEQWFCTTLCTDDSECGEGAVCTGDGAGTACVPEHCL